MPDYIIKVICFIFFASSSCLAKANEGNKHGIISKTDTLRITTPSGTVPRLPHLIWVTFSDGNGGYRQVRWDNAALSTEQELADAEKYPAGSRYTIDGYIIGDNTTANGLPVKAFIEVTDKYSQTPGCRPVAEPLPLNCVRINGDNRLTSNRDLAIRTILSWDVSQQLYNYRDTYGMPTEGYRQSDGWDSPTTKLKGHGSGHYMSALAFAFASTTDAAMKDSLRSRMRRMVSELRQCQERTFVWNDSLGRYWEARDFAPEHELHNMKGTWAAFNEHKKDYARYGYGYLGAIPAHHAVLIEMYRPYNNSDWVWAPYYAIHKQLAGLIDIATYVDDKDIANKALLIAKDMGLWVWNRLHHRTFVKTDGTREERRERPGNRYEMWNMYIAGEDGGMGESLSRLSEMVDDKKESNRLLEAASFFDSPAFFDPLSRNIDDIRTRHANQHIPKITSALRSYRGNGKDYYYNLSLNFWQLVQGRYAYATGGVGNGEMFRQPYTQMLSMNNNMATDHKGRPVPNPTLNETCCAYNLAKLTKDLNCFDPDNAMLMDYYERVLYNQIVGSLHPEHYLTTYHYAVGLNASKPWGNRTPQESCCGGTGSENHVKYQEAAYFVSDNTIWVALYMPTTATWCDKGVVIEQECKWPAEKSTIRIVKGGKRFAMKLRMPYWATDRFEVRLNGKTISHSNRTSEYVEIAERKWKKGDIVEITMPFTKHIHYGPDKVEVDWLGALMYGPLVMATKGIDKWDEAVAVVDSQLDSITANAPTSASGTHGNLYTLTLNGRTFVPDYAADRNSTHYLRIYSETSNMSTSQLGNSSTSIALAEERIKEQEAWMKMEKKVPEHAPWAPHGYARMVKELNSIKNEGSAADVGNLNVILNTMRPGNLAELEDLQPLLELMEKAKELGVRNEELGEALKYAEMVVKYVSDGSGTLDMIREACGRIEEASPPTPLQNERGVWMREF